MEDLIRPVESGTNRKEDIKAAIAEVMSSVDPEIKSDLTVKQIIQVARAKAFATTYKCAIVDVVIVHLLRLRYSHKRKSRDEMVKALQSTLANDQTSDTIRRKLLGM